MQNASGNFFVLLQADFIYRIVFAVYFKLLSMHIMYWRETVSIKGFGVAFPGESVHHKVIRPVNGFPSYGQLPSVLSCC